VIGQIILRLFIEPIQDHRRLFGRIANAATVYENYWLYKDGYKSDEQARAKLDAAADALHGLAAEFRASVMVIPFYDWLATTGLIRARQDVWAASKRLLKWAHSPAKLTRGQNARNFFPFFK